MARVYRPYFEDYCIHCVRFYLARQYDPDPVPLAELNDCSRKNLEAVEKAWKEFNDNQLYLINECYSPTVPFQMFLMQLDSACEHLLIDRHSAFLELRDAFYRIAMYRGLIGQPYSHFKKLHERTGIRVDEKVWERSWKSCEHS